jgi:hypothetical protein
MKAALAAMIAAAIVLTGIFAFANPGMNIPVVSEVVCHLKGDTWYSGGLLIPAGCYQPAAGN